MCMYFEGIAKLDHNFETERVFKYRRNQHSKILFCFLSIQ